MRSLPPGSIVLASLVLFAAPARAETVIPLDGDVPDDATEFLLIPFDVPAGTRNIQIDHDDLSAANILDWGLADQADLTSSYSALLQKPFTQTWKPCEG